MTTSAASIAARLNRLTLTRAHREATIVAGIGTFFDIFDIFLTGVLSSVLIQEFHSAGRRCRRSSRRASSACS